MAEEGDAIEALEPGHVLKSTYVVERLIGEGGFGMTYLAHDNMLDRHVAIKEFFPATCARRDGRVSPSRLYSTGDFHRDRISFLDEARTVARFDHPNIVKVHSYFEDNNTAYMVMDYLQGRTLQEKVMQSGILDEEAVVAIVTELCEALAVVHEAGLLHRDIKPHNIMLTDSGHAILLDFGIARRFLVNELVTHSTVVTQGYAPPEQYVERATRGPYSDLYALGGCMYFALTGERPPSASDRCLQNVPFRPPQLASVHMRRCIEWAMAVQPDERPQSAAQFAQALREQIPVPSVEAATRKAWARALTRDREREIKPFRIRKDEASTLAELAVLGERFPEDFDFHLRSGDLDIWLTTMLGETALVEKLRNVRLGSTPGDGHVLELSLRAVFLAAGMDAMPVLSVMPDPVDIEVHFGCEESEVVRLHNKGRGNMWGTATLEPPLPGATVTRTFEGNDCAVEIRVAATADTPVAYDGALVLRVDGAPRATRIGLTCHVIAVSVEVTPWEVDLGVIPFGTGCRTEMRLTCDAPSRVRGHITTDNQHGELSVEVAEEGYLDRFAIVVRTRPTPSSGHYERHVKAHTQFGEYDIPVRFAIEGRRQAALFWMLGGGLVGGLGFGLVRSFLATRNDAFMTWFASIPEKEPAPAWILLCLLGTGFLALWLWLLEGHDALDAVGTTQAASSPSSQGDR